MFGVDFIVVGLFILISLWYILFKHPRDYVYVLPFAMAFFFYIQVGTRWTPAKVVPIILIVGILIRGAIDRDCRRIFRMPGWLILFLSILVISTLFNYRQLSRMPRAMLGAFQSPELRTFIQLISYLVSLIFFLIAAYSLRRPENGKRLITLYIFEDKVHFSSHMM